MKVKVFVVILIIITLFLRLQHIDYGLPLSYFIDETDHSDPAIKYALNFKSQIIKGNLGFFKPETYVYGSFPLYAFSGAILIYKSATQLFSYIPSRADYEVLLRIITTLVSISIPVFTYLIYKKLFNNKYYALLALIFCLFNWKLWYHSIYINQDIYLTVCMCIALYFILLASDNSSKSKIYLLIAAFWYGAAFGTKITTLFSIPAFLIYFFFNKNIKQFVLFMGVALTSYFITNPFSIITFNDFLARLIQMNAREGGVVFGSVDMSPFKYIIDLGHISTWPILILGVLGFTYANKSKVSKNFIVLLGTYVFFFVFLFSTRPRNSERYLLPLIPIIIVFCTYAIQALSEKFKTQTIQKYIFYLAISFIFLYNYILGLNVYLQMSVTKPVIAAYYWANSNIRNSKILVYTEDGRNPFSKINGTKVYVYQLYVSKGAQYFYPQDPTNYDYIVLSSKPMQNFKRDYVVKTYHEYVNKWVDFENLVTKSNNFKLIKSFETSYGNPLNFSDIKIYRRL